MKGVTVTHKEWLAALGKGSPMTKFSAPLEHPAPSYNFIRDQLECFATARFGDHSWPLSAEKIVYPLEERGDEYYRWLMKFLLEGAIFAEAAEFQNYYCQPTNSITRKKFDRKIHLFVVALRRNSIRCRRDLLEHWRLKNQCFLRQEWQDWVKPEYHPTFRNQWWPQLLANAHFKSK